MGALCGGSNKNKNTKGDKKGGSAVKPTGKMQIDTKGSAKPKAATSKNPIINEAQKKEIAAKEAAEKQRIATEKANKEAEKQRIKEEEQKKKELAAAEALEK